MAERLLTSLLAVFMMIGGSYCYSQKNPSFSEMEFDSLAYHWKTDTLGTKFYRRQIIQSNGLFLESMKGRTREEVKKYLGLPDYECVMNHGYYSFEYHLECYPYHRQNEYVYKPQRDCDEPDICGASCYIDFNTNGIAVHIMFSSD